MFIREPLALVSCGVRNVGTLSVVVSVGRASWAGAEPSNESLIEG
jgi:hypothetical protein